MAVEREVKIKLGLEVDNTGAVKAVKDEIQSKAKDVVQAAAQEGAAIANTTAKVEEQGKAFEAAGEAAEEAVSSYDRAKQVMADAAAEQAALEEQAKNFAAQLQEAANSASSLEDVVAVADKISEAFIKGAEAAGEIIDTESAMEVIESTRDAAIKAYEEREAAATAVLEAEKKRLQEVAEANERAARKTAQQWSTAKQQLAAAATSGAQFLTVVRMFASESDTLQEFVREFTLIQTTIQGLASGYRAMDHLSKSLKAFGQASSGAATASRAVATASTAASAAQSTMVASSARAAAGNTAVAVTAGTAATATTALGAAATYAGIALNAMIPILGIITVGVAAVQLAYKLWGDTAEDALEKIQDALKKEQAENEKSLELFRMRKQAIDAETASLESQLRIKKQLGDANSAAISEEERKQKDRKTKIDLVSTTKQAVTDADNRAAEKGAKLEAEQRELEELFAEAVSNMRKDYILSQTGAISEEEFVQSANVVRSVQLSLDTNKAAQQRIAEARTDLDDIYNASKDGRFDKDDLKATRNIAADLGDRQLLTDIEAAATKAGSSYAESAATELKAAQRRIENLQRDRESLANEGDRAYEKEQKDIKDYEDRARQLNDFEGRRSGQRVLARIDKIDDRSSDEAKLKLGREIFSEIGKFLDPEARERISNKLQRDEVVSSGEFRADYNDAKEFTEEEMKTVTETTRRMAETFQELSFEIEIMQQRAEELKEQLAERQDQVEEVQRAQQQ